ncbi:thiamine pyrophosphate-dependent enzyme, partial [Chloroflexota bacterium]
GVENEVSVLKIGTPYPMPDDLVKEMLKSVKEIVVVEELEPVVENQVKVLAQEQKIDVLIHGKDVVPLVGELSTRKVSESLAKVLGVKPPMDFQKLDKVEKEAEALLPIRPPALCPGCPHRATLYSVNVAALKYKKDFHVEPIKTGDIGCYALGFNPPLNSDDAAICMGAAFGLANGFAHANNKIPVIAHLGDSTFFHSGIAPMVNAVYNNARVVMLVLDNSITGQTGFQPNPCSGSTALGAAAPVLKPEDVARACQVPYVEVVDPYEVNRTTSIIAQALRSGGPAVVVSRQVCQVLHLRALKKKGEKEVPCEVIPAKCNDCPTCITALGCSAIIFKDTHVVIDATQCSGCGVCIPVCPRGAIKKGDK